MQCLQTRAFAVFTLLLALFVLPSVQLSLAQQKPKDSSPPGSAKVSPPKKAPSESDALQQAIDDAGNDRAALVRNLEGFLKDYPESQQRPQIYRALVEASIQLQDTARAANYAERIVALKPEDISMTMLAIQLLERTGDEAALRRAMNYCSRVLDYVQRDSIEDKSPKLSKQEWQTENNRDEMNIRNLRGGIAFKLKDYAPAQKDFQASMAISPSPVAGETLGEIAELHKDLPSAIREYARAFALSGTSDGGARRREIRQKLGNVWRLAHGSDAGLGDYLLQAYDESASSPDSARPRKNANARVPYDFVLRSAPDGPPFPLASQKGKIVVLSFWATWCGPCRALEPHFERLAAEFQGNPEIIFLAANCDEDESLVPAYLQEVKPHVPVVFADGLDRLLAVHAFPTVVILDRSGKIAYRAEGFDPDAVDAELRGAIRRALGTQ
ncbi:MAG TPA: thioredoxin domain-containing protein [Candidatus Acidoferrum sp.]|nr:thioredoxin domain-containing protein [Candidatus Acidoferrum sp.]